MPCSGTTTPQPERRAEALSDRTRHCPARSAAEKKVVCSCAISTGRGSMNCSVGPSIGLPSPGAGAAGRPRHRQEASGEAPDRGCCSRSDACREPDGPIHRVEMLDAVALELAEVERRRVRNVKRYWNDSAGGGGCGPQALDSSARSDRASAFDRFEIVEAEAATALLPISPRARARARRRKESPAPPTRWLRACAPAPAGAARRRAPTRSAPLR